LKESTDKNTPEDIIERLKYEKISPDDLC